MTEPSPSCFSPPRPLLLRPARRRPPTPWPPEASRCGPPCREQPARGRRAQRAPEDLRAGTIHEVAEVRRAPGAPAPRRGPRRREGETLALLDDTDYRLANDRARAALAVAEANRAHALAEKRARGQPAEDRRHHRQGPPLGAGGAAGGEASLAQVRAEAAIAASSSRAPRSRAPFAGRMAKRSRRPRRHARPGARRCSPWWTTRSWSSRRRWPRAISPRCGWCPGPALRSMPCPTRGSRGGGAGRAARGRAHAARSRSWSRCRDGPASWAGSSRARACASATWRARSSSRPRRSCATAATRSGPRSSWCARARPRSRRSGSASRPRTGCRRATGLAQGDVVVLDPPTALSSGAPVEPQNGRPAPAKPSGK